MNGSPVYTFLKNQPWCHHEPILNPPLSKSITPALPLSLCLIFCSTSPSFTLCSCLSNSSLNSHSFSFLFFMVPYSSTFPFSRPCPSPLTESLALFFCLFFFWRAWSNWITKKRSRVPEMPGCSDYHKLCLSCGFTKKKLVWVHEGESRKIKVEKNEE